MIHEHVVLTIKPGRESEFEAAIARARAIFARADGHRSLELHRCVEEPSSYLMIVGWDGVEDHMVGFRESDLFTEWRELAGPFFAAPPAMRHYDGVELGAG